MASINARPIIFPLSNPVRLSECSFNDAVDYTNGQVLFASGSPFPEQEFQGSTLYPGQGNNMYIFPGTPHSVTKKLRTFLSHDNFFAAGIGLAAILGRVKSVTDGMVEAASLGLADSLTDEEHELGLLYPRVERSEMFSVIPLYLTR